MQNKKVLIGILIAIVFIAAVFVALRLVKKPGDNTQTNNTNPAKVEQMPITSENIRNVFPADFPIYETATEKPAVLNAKQSLAQGGTSVQYDYATKQTLAETVSAFEKYFKSKNIDYKKVVDLEDVKALAVNSLESQLLINVSFNKDSKLTVVNLSLLEKYLENFPVNYPFEKGAEVKDVEVPANAKIGSKTIQKDYYSTFTVDKNKTIFKTYLQQNNWKVQPSQIDDVNAVQLVATKNGSQLNIFIRKDPASNKVQVQSVFSVIR